MLKKKKLRIVSKLKWICSLSLVVIMTTGLLGCNAKDKNSANKDDKKENTNKVEEASETSNKEEKTKIGKEEQAILDGEVRVYSLEEGKKEGEVVRLDLNLDGTKDIIEVGEVIFDEGEECMEIKVNDATIEYVGEAIPQDIVAVALDKEKIVISAYCFGPSDDPMSEVFIYDGKELKSGGKIYSNLSNATRRDIGDESAANPILKKDMIKSPENFGTISNYAYKYYLWDGSKLTAREDEEYDYVRVSEILELKKAITVYDKRDKNSESKIIEPGNIHPIKKGPDNWNYIKSDRSEEGWFTFESDEYDELFTNSNMAG